MKLINKLVLSAALALGAASSAFAQANLSFSLADGGKLRMALLEPLDFTISATPTASACVFLFEGVGDALTQGGGVGVMATASTISFSVNGGPASLVNYGNAGVTGGPVVPTDFYIADISTVSDLFLQLGDVVHLSAGEVVFDSTAYFVPTSGVYTANIFDNTATLLSTGTVVSVPEPGTSAGLAGLAVLGLVALRRRR